MPPADPAAVPPPGYQVQLDVFSGPLDLLLYLVRKDEVELYDLSLERLTAQFVEYLEAHLPRLDLDIAGEFISVAAHLIYLKSRRLLPVEQQPAAGELDGEDEDPRWELIRQLLEYKKFKDAAAHLHDREGARLDLFPRPPDAAQADARLAAEALAGQEAGAGGRGLGEVGVLDLIAAFQRVLGKLEARLGAGAVRTVAEERFSVADKIEYLLRLADAAGGMALGFETLFASATSRTEIVVTFLALLELVRLKRLRITQSSPFEEIAIYKQSEFDYGTER